MTPAGRHLRTLNALTGAVRYQFGYDTAGRLASVTDGDGNVTAIERDPSGVPTAVVGPYGQRTTLQVDGNGYLSLITGPGGQSLQLDSAPDGLLASLTDPRDGLHEYTYDENGRLTENDEPGDGFKTLSRVDGSSGFTITVSTALGRQTTYQAERLPAGGARRTTTDPAGAKDRGGLRGRWQPECHLPGRHTGHPQDRPRPALGDGGAHRDLAGDHHARRARVHAHHVAGGQRAG